MKKVKHDLNEIKFDALIPSLCDMVGQHLEFAIFIKDHKGRQIIEMSSNDLTNFAGVLSPVFETLAIVSGMGSVTVDEQYYWLPIHFAWKYKCGGSNGRKLCDAFYHFEKQHWVVEPNNTF